MASRKIQQSVPFGDRLRKLMEASKMTQVELAGRLNLTQAAIHNYLAGRIPKADILLEISSLFGVSVDDLLHKEVSEIAPSPTGLYAQEVEMFHSDLRTDLAAYEASLREAEAKLREAQGHVKKVKDGLGVAKIIVSRLDSIQKLNRKRAAKPQ